MSAYFSPAALDTIICMHGAANGIGYSDDRVYTEKLKMMVVYGISVIGQVISLCE